MELVLVLVVVVAVVALIYFNRSAKNLDINNDGKVDVADAVTAVENAAEGVKQTVKKAAVKAKTASTRKTAAKKPTARGTRSKK